MSTHRAFMRCLSVPPMATCWMPSTLKGRCTVLFVMEILQWLKRFYFYFNSYSRLLHKR